MQPNPLEEPVVDRGVMRFALAGVQDQRGKIARMLAGGELISLRRGLYATRRELDPFGLAGLIYGPSYVSFESALSWYGMIPEGVREVTSASLKRGNSFENEFGRFRFRQVPRSIYPVGIRRIADSELPFLMASPTKALADRIACEPGFRSMADVERWREGTRLEFPEALERTELEQCATGYGRPAVRWLLKFAEKRRLLGS